jgi:hypothetical protein
MKLRIAAIGSLLLAGLFLGSCNGSMTPEERMTAADSAAAKEDYEKALELYQGLVVWEGEGEVARDKRFKAALESIKCQVQMGRFEESSAAFKKLEESFAEEMGAPGAYKHALAVATSMERKKAPIAVTADLLKYASEKYPDYKDKFDIVVEELKKRATTDEEKEALRKLGYL